ncbi:nitrate- and nitrite sensing domain-containing protein [Thermopolyspora sp. NPDC052614]|uniref:sensor histidine kinase n=1 Tax=Thermopolyspora sp. NPDC052614 TaxID=3155682 RepID=UPI0034267B90
MPRTIRARLTWILAVPTTLLLGFTGLEVAARFDTRSDAHTTARQIELVLAGQELVHALQRERGLTAGLLGGEYRFRGELEAQRRRSDQARAELGPLLADATRRGVPRLRGALDRLSGLGALRASADASRTGRPESFAFYTAAIGAINDALYDGDAAGGDLTRRRGLEALWTLGRAQEAAGQERDTLTGGLAATVFTPEEYVRFIEARATRIDALAQFARLATTAQAAALSTAQQSRAATTMAAIESRATASPRGRNLSVSARDWWDAAAAFADDLRDVQRLVGVEARAQAGEAERRGTQELVVLAVLGGVLLLGTLLLGVVTSRSILRPLRRLTQEADDVAERRLPEAVARIQSAADPQDAIAEDEPGPGRRQDEFGAVIRALGNVHRTALRLAAEQAVLRRNTAESLANLGRRNQSLVRRQLGFISALERDESDPAALANLFELDHLATRMRRNAESLLILVGERTPRAAAEPVAMGDVLRSALAEVEDYRRVVLRRVDHDVVRGSAVAEVAHLLAELIENALVFSAQDQDVEIQARCDATEYHIAIVDQGVGMDAEGLATANAKLRGERSFLVAPTRQLGLFVVGRLAERLGIKVWLHDSPLAGITARVVLPVDLLVRDAASVASPSAPSAFPGSGGSVVGEHGDGYANGRVATGSGGYDEAPSSNGLVASDPSDVAGTSGVPGTPGMSGAPGAPGVSGVSSPSGVSGRSAVYDWSGVSGGAGEPAGSAERNGFADSAGDISSEEAMGSAATGLPAHKGHPGVTTSEFVAVVVSPEPAVPPAPGTPPPPPAIHSPSSLSPSSPADPLGGRHPDASAPPASSSGGHSTVHQAPSSVAQPPLPPLITPKAKPPYRLSVRRPAPDVDGSAERPQARTAAGDGARETTANGLVRRVPRTDRPRGDEPVATGVSPDGTYDGTHEGTHEGTHDETFEHPSERVRSILNEFRAGMRQAEQTGPNQEPR